LQWGAAADSVAGYHVYRSFSPGGPFKRLTGVLVAGTNFIDTAIADPKYTYMVRAVKLETNPSGSYYNPSQGAFASVTNLVPQILLSISSITNGVLVSWNSRSGGIYHVDGRTDLFSGAWSNLSLSLTANSSVYLWADTNISEAPSRYYRVSMP